MTFHVPEAKRITRDNRGYRATHLITEPNCGNYGAFYARFGTRDCFMIASDAGGWEHVSVSIGGAKADRTPTWEEMCKVKAWFWDDEDTVLQFHPPRSQYVNVHPYVLHLWRQTDTNFPTPPMEFI